MKVTTLGEPKRRWKKHVFKEGARYHVISYYGAWNWKEGKIVGKRVCSELSCEINRENEIGNASR